MAFKSFLKIFFFFCIVVLASCVGNKKYVYLQDRGGVNVDSSGLIKVTPYSYKLQRGDVLYISLTTDDERLNRIFVPGSNNAQTMNMASGNTSGSALYFIGFTIDNNGEIELPYLGKIRVEGLEINEAKYAIVFELKKFFKIFYIQIKVAEFKFSVLGYVNRPGQFFFQQNKVTLFEAISQAGELQNLAQRYEVHLYRQYKDGVKLHKLDLTDRAIINSAFWYIQPNDILYVVPLKVRAIGDLSSLQSSFGVIAPLLSTLLLVLNTYILVKNL
jgi:polysaccharide export outer membrane protein